MLWSHEPVTNLCVHMCVITKCMWFLHVYFCAKSGDLFDWQQECKEHRRWWSCCCGCRRMRIQTLGTHWPGLHVCRQKITKRNNNIIILVHPLNLKLKTYWFICIEFANEAKLALNYIRLAHRYVMNYSHSSNKICVKRLYWRIWKWG